MEWLSASELAARIREGELSAAGCVEYFCGRIERLDPAYNLVVQRRFQAARARARDADAARARGELWGPLHGVPMTVKECFGLAGELTTCGWPRLSTHRPREHSAVVARLLSAGAIIIGKTNLPVLAGDMQSYNSIYGCSNNPWDIRRSPGGSSGGSAGALAAGFTPVEVGSDIGGSIRGPAHCCGVMGLKPTLGVIDSAGHVPPAPFVSVNSNLFVCGPMARCCEDLALMLDVLSGPAAAMARGWQLKLPPPRALTPDRLRIAVCSRHQALLTDDEISAAVESAGRSLARVGATVEWGCLPDLDVDQALECYTVLLQAEMAGINAPLSHGAYLKNEHRRNKIRQQWASFFERFDALLCPVAPTAALLHDHSEPVASREITVNGEQEPYLSWVQWAGLVIMANLPSTVVPAGETSDGMPVGVQIVTAEYEDRLGIAIGGMLEKHHRCFKPPPGLANQVPAKL